MVAAAKRLDQLRYRAQGDNAEAGNGASRDGGNKSGIRGVLRRWLIDPEPQLAAPDPGTRLPSTRVPNPASAHLDPPRNRRALT